MRDYGTVFGTFWTRGSGKLLRGDPPAQVVALYLMTGPQSSMTGLYHLALPTLAHEIGSPLEGASKALRRVCGVQIAFYDEADELVWVPKMAHYQIGPSLAPNDKRVKGVLSSIRPFAGHRFYYEFVRTYGSAYHLKIQATPKALASPLEGASKALRSQDQDQEQDQEQEDRTPQRAADAADAATTTEEPIGTQASHDAFQLSVQKRPKKSKDNLRHVGPDTPVAGLDQVDRCRRRFAVEWRAADRYNGTAYPDSPGADRTAIAHVLGYHRRNKIEEEWQSWMLRVFQAYLEIADDRYILNACHPLALLPRNLPRIVTAMKEQG